MRVLVGGASGGWCTRPSNVRCASVEEAECVSRLTNARAGRRGDQRRHVERAAPRGRCGYVARCEPVSIRSIVSDFVYRGGRESADTTRDSSCFNRAATHRELEELQTAYAQQPKPP